MTTIIKIIVTLLGLAYILINFDINLIINTLTNANWGWVALGFIIMNISLVVRAYRWYLLLQGLNVTIPFTRLIELYFIGNFFNAFLPSGFGGDAVRVIEVAQDTSADVAAGTVIVDRMTGLMMLFLMALLALPFRPDSFPSQWVQVLAITAVIGLLGGFILLDGRLVRLFGSWLPGPLSPVGQTPVAKLLTAVHGAGWPAIFKALAVSLGFNLLQIGWWVTSGLALSINLPATHYLLASPIMALALLIPSISGLGVRETIAPYLFAIAPVTAEQAVTLSLLVFIITRFASLVGAPIYLWRTINPRATTKNKE